MAIKVKIISNLVISLFWQKSTADWLGFCLFCRNSGKNSVEISGKNRLWQKLANPALKSFRLNELPNWQFILWFRTDDQWFRSIDLFLNLSLPEQRSSTPPIIDPQVRIFTIYLYFIANFSLFDISHWSFFEVPIIKWKFILPANFV